MKKRHALSLAAALFFAASSPVLAGDGAAHDWSGYYFGGHVGYGFASNDWVLVRNAGGSPSGHIGDVMTSQDMDGVLGGIQFGYNKQENDRVFGVEGELSIPDLSGYGEWQNHVPLHRDASTDINWMARLMARGGFAFDNTLVYVRGGLAFAGVDYIHTADRTPPASPRNFTASELSWGPALGVGVEQALTDKLSLRFDYTYTVLSNGSASPTDGTRTAVFDVDQGVHSVTVGVSYHF